MSKPRLLFLTDRSEWHQQDALKSAPAEIEVIMKRGATEAELIALMPDIDFVISERNQPVTAGMINASSRLKLVVRLGSLTDGIDLKAARAKGARVSVQPVLGAIFVAEHLLMMMLAVQKRLGRSLAVVDSASSGLPVRRTDENTFAFNWLGFNDIGGLYDKTVAILGMGEIGVELARRLKSFRLKQVYYHKRTRYSPTVENELGLNYALPQDCIPQADVLVCLLPFSAETDRSIDAHLFGLMKPSTTLIHAGSGSVIDEQALIAALRTGQLAGAALDTYEYEPLQPDNPLVQVARDPTMNLLLTPHTAGASLPSGRAGDYSELIRYLRGESLQYRVI